MRTCHLYAQRCLVTQKPFDLVEVGHPNTPISLSLSHKLSCINPFPFFSLSLKVPTKHLTNTTRSSQASKNLQLQSMASSGARVGLVLLLVAITCGGAMAQSSCTSTLMTLAPCLNYVTGNSTSPSSSCCSQLGNVVQTSPQCLCLLLNNSGASLGINVNQTLALNLPGSCKVQTPPMSQCQGNPNS